MNDREKDWEWKWGPKAREEKSSPAGTDSPKKYKEANPPKEKRGARASEAWTKGGKGRAWRKCGSRRGTARAKEITSGGCLKRRAPVYWMAALERTTSVLKKADLRMSAK